MASNKNWLSNFGSSLLENYVTNIPGIGLIFKAFGLGNLVKGVAQDALNSNEFQSWVADKTQSGLTGRDIAINQQNLQNLHDQYSYHVQGMQDAGLNPALMYGSSGGSSAPAMSNGGSAGNLSTLIALATLPAQLKMMKAQTRSIEAGTAKTEVETEGGKLSNEWLSVLNQAEVDSKRSNIELNRKRAGEIDANIDRLEAETRKAIEEAKSEVEKRNLMVTQELLNQASASRINALIPYEQAYMQAKTDAEKASAQYALAQAAYTNGLLTSGIIYSNASKAEAEAIVSQFEARITDPKHNPERGLNKIPREIISAIHNVVSYCNPIKFGK